jgi:hypothetical protein
MGNIAHVKHNKIKEGRLLIVAELYKKGKSYRDISSEVMRRLELKTYSLQTVHKDIQFLLAEWKKTRIDDIDLLIQAELEKIAICEAELWEQWEKSKTDYKNVSQKKKGEVIGTGKSKKENGDIRTTRVEKNEENVVMLGDPRYMAALSDCREQRIKLLGLYAPTKIAQTDKEGNDVNFTSFLMQVNTIEE